MSVVNRENPFDECFRQKYGNIKVKTLQKYANKCDKITYGCDEMKLISKDDFLSKCPCFQMIQNNYTNSKDVSLDCSKFRNCIFESITISLDLFDSFLLYKVFGVYEGKAYNLFDFKFYYSTSKTAKQNKYLSDILIHGKAWRLQVVSGGKFNIGEFLLQLVGYDTTNNAKYISAFNEYYITRFDFRFDFFHKNTIPHLQYTDVFSSSARKTYANLIKEKNSKKLYTGWTCGDRKNKYIYTRMYQKQIESLDKGHGELYIDYLEYDGKVRRLEFEFLSKFTTARGHFSFADEFYEHKLTKQVFEYIGISEVTGYFSKPKNKIDIPFEQLGSYQKKRLITQTKNNLVKLHLGGINPYVITNSALLEWSPLFEDTIPTYFEASLHGNKYEDIMQSLETSHITTKELYDKLYKNQLGVDQ